MPTCPNCGNESGGRFCAHCGGSMPGSPAESSMPPPPPPSGATSAGLPENGANALCYLLGFITGILFLVIEPYSRNPRTRFHAFQSIFFNVAIIAYYVALGFLFMIMPGPIVIMLGMLTGLLGLGIFLFWLFLMWKAYNGDTFVIPVIGPLAQQQSASR
jgi:uncharacterized membrane protein